MSRPSLLSAEQQAEVQRNSILDELDGTFAKPAAAGKPALHTKVIAALAGVCVLVVAAAAIDWLIKERSRDAVLASLVALPAPVAPPMIEESAAAVLRDMPPVAPAPAPVVLAAPPPAPTPTARHAVPRMADVVKEAKPLPARVPRVKPIKVAALDRDEMLLEALVMRVQAHRRVEKNPAPKAVRLATRLKQCKALGGTRAEACRKRLCAAGRKHKAACKVAAAARKGAR